MKPMLLTAFGLLTAVALNAQFSLTPQLGFEQSRTNLNYANGLRAANVNGNLKAALKMDYRLKGGHGPFVNIATSPAPVSFVFNNAGMLDNNLQAAKNNLQLRLEAGYQYTSLPISLGRKLSAAKTQPSETPRVATQPSRCGAMYRSHCGERRMARVSSNNGPLNLRLQPAVAFAYVPSSTESLVQNANGFEYKAGMWKTAVVPSMGFEFAKGRQRLFTISVFYTKPLTEENTTATITSGPKAINVPLQSKTTTWGLTLGVPLSFARANGIKEKKEKRECHKTYYRRCIRVQ